jgi:hypothetical protein
MEPGPGAKPTLRRLGVHDVTQAKHRTLGRGLPAAMKTRPFDWSTGRPGRYARLVDRPAPTITRESSPTMRSSICSLPK